MTQPTIDGESQWMAWAMAKSGGDPARARLATDAAMAAIANGYNPLPAAQNALGIPLTAAALPPGTGIASPADNAGFYRSAPVTAVVTFLGGGVFLL